MNQTDEFAACSLVVRQAARRQYLLQRNRKLIYNGITKQWQRAFRANFPHRAKSAIQWQRILSAVKV
jgi:hypothetical protein